MSVTLRPQPFAVLLARALVEHEAARAIFGLPRRSFWRGKRTRRLSVEVAASEGRADTPLGPAAGPHTQLAHNIVAAWLAGSRVLELKTVQVKDRLELPRPCIDAADVGYNVEWSQELSLEQSLEQYVAAWHLIHVLGARGIADVGNTHFEASVGYDLAGIRSDGVARFLDGLTDAARSLKALRDSLPPALRGVADVPVPARVIRAVTLSTFHGCPPDEIEAITRHLMKRHGLNVVIKLNPTLLGFDAVDELLHRRLGYDDVELDPATFERDLQWPAALALIARLSDFAGRSGRVLGVKLSNTLIVRNTRHRLEGEHVYLSGAPLHVVTTTLAHRFAEATGGKIRLSFSAGADAENFADTVACGFAPVTTCTDLLKPTGYRRLPRYLKALEAEMERLDADTVEALILRRDGASPVAAATLADDAHAVRAAAHRNLANYAARVAGDPRYHAATRHAAPRRHERLALFDCASCNDCVLVCPNGAFFAIETPPRSTESADLAIERGALVVRPARFEVEREAQWVLYAGFCNECGNCDTFCPEAGGPWRVKPRFYGSRADYDAAAPEDGFWLEAGLMRGRFLGAEHVLETVADGLRFADGVIEATLEPDGRLRSARVLEAREGHVLSLARAHVMRLLGEAIERGVNPVSAMRLPVLRGAPISA